MRIIGKDPRSFTLQVSAEDTAYWARKPGAAWPCSELAGKRFSASFDDGNLWDLTVDGKRGVDVPMDEFNAIVQCMLEEAREKTGIDYYAH